MKLRTFILPIPFCAAYLRFIAEHIFISRNLRGRVAEGSQELFVFQCFRAYRNRIGRSRQKQVPTRSCYGKEVFNRRLTIFKTSKKNKGAGLGGGGAL